MSTITLIARKELRESLRDGRARAALIALLLLLGVTLAIGLQQTAARQAEVTTSSAADRAIWDGQGLVNPHSAAHFGQYAFKPAGALAAFDPGLEPYLGTSLWIEAHDQNFATHRPADDRFGLAPIDGLNAAFVLQVLAPLLLIFLGHGLVAGERERQTLRQVLASGVSPQKWLIGKWLALAAIAGLIWLAAFAVLLIGAHSVDALQRALWLAGTYALYLAIVCALVIVVSTHAAQTRSALLLLLCGWALLLLVAPRVASQAAEWAAPSPEPAAYQRAISKAKGSYINAHDPNDARAVKLLAETLVKYGVSKKEDLPVSFEGIVLDADEEAGHVVFAEMDAKRQRIEATQREVLRTLSLVTPLLPLQAASTAFAGTDNEQHRHFSQATETYRRDLQKRMNDAMRDFGKGQDFDYLAQPALWKSVPIYTYNPPKLQVTRSTWVDMLILTAWAFAAAVLLRRSAKHLQQEARA